MRKILFRGKVKLPNSYRGYNLSYRNGDWVYGLMNSNESIRGIFVDTNTIGQYTGLDDKNDVQIFEGDIVRLNGEWEEYGGNTFGVVFTNGCFYLCRNPDTVCFLLKTFMEQAEVVGNIYDNPELLN